MPKIFYNGVPCTPPIVNGYPFAPVEDHEPFYSADVEEKDLGLFFIGEDGSPYTLEIPGAKTNGPTVPPAPKDGDQNPPTPEELLATANKIQKKSDLAAWAASHDIGAALDPEGQTRDQMIALIAENLAPKVPAE